MKRGLLILIGCLSWLSWVSAQEDQFVFEAERELSIETVRTAAQPLLNRGADVAVYWVNSGDEDDFTARLQAANLMQDDLVQDNLIAVYVSMDPRYSEIRWGDTWDAELATHADNVRLNILNVNLRERQYERAFTETLRTLDEVLAGNTALVPVNPTSPNYDYETEEGLGGFLTSFIFCLLFPFLFILNLLGIGKGGYAGSRRPRYKSNWSGGRGGRSGGSW